MKKAHSIQAELSVPGDKSISHRSVMLSSLSNGPCYIDGFLPSEDCLATVDCFRKLGVTIEEMSDDGEPWQAGRKDEKGAPMHGPTRLLVHGKGPKLHAPTETLYCGNSGTTMRLISGILAAQPFRTRLTGDESLSGRTMKRIMTPLNAMGANVFSEADNDCAPLIIEGGNLQPIRYTLPVASAQVKSAILLAGMLSEGKTTVVEPQATRDHTETMLRHFQVKTVRNGKEVTIYGGQVPESSHFTVPGDISSAAFWLVAAAAQPGSHLIIQNVGLNPTRTGIIKVLLRMGAQITEVLTGSEHGEPIGHVTVKGGVLKGTVIEGDEIPNVIDELPVLAVAGALATGRTIIRDAQELRNKETDRLSAVAHHLAEMGANVRQLFDGMEIEGGTPLKGTTLDSYGDHRIAMAFAIAGLFAEGETTITNVECVSTSYPGFDQHLKRFQSKAITMENQTPVISSLPQDESKAKANKTQQFPM